MPSKSRRLLSRDDIGFAACSTGAKDCDQVVGDIRAEPESENEHYVRLVHPPNKHTLLPDDTKPSGILRVKENATR
jgi:hypothetical protein